MPRLGLALIRLACAGETVAAATFSEPIELDEIVMTIQFSKQPIAVLSDGLLQIESGLVCRLVCARDDPGKERIRMWLIGLDDAQLHSGLGLTVGDIAILRSGTKPASPSR